MSLPLISTIGFCVVSAMTLAALVCSFLAWRRKAPSGQQPATMQQVSKRLHMNFNMSIASLHAVTNQLIGMQLSGANTLALLVSTTSVVAGTVSVAVMCYPDAVPLWMMAGCIGAGLAVLIEGLTLGALIRIRLANKKIREVAAKLEPVRDEQLARIQQPAPQINVKAYRASIRTYKAALKLAEQEYLRKLSQATAPYRRARACSYPLAFFGAVASTCAGGMFYHTLLVKLVWYHSLGLSALFALAVSVTFVSSELFKDEQEQAIREGFDGGSLAEAAIEQETRRMTYRGVFEQSTSFMQTQEANQMVTAGFKDVLSSVMRAMKRIEETGHEDTGEPDTPGGQVVIRQEEPPSGHWTPVLPGASGQHEGSGSRPPEEQSRQTETSERRAESVAPAEPDQPDRTLRSLLDSPEAAAPDDESRSAAYPGLHRPARARVFRLEAERVRPAGGQQSVDPDQVFPVTAADTDETKAADTARRIAEDRAAYPRARQKDVADRLGLSERTVRRYWKKRAVATEEADDDDESGHGHGKVVR